MLDRCFVVLCCSVMGVLTMVENYIRRSKWNQDLVTGLEDDYEVVYPFQLRERNRVGIDTKNYYFTNATYHYESATFVIRSSFKRFKLHLRLNRELIPRGAKYKEVLKPSSVFVNTEKVENCYYQGQLHNEQHSAVALSSCSGLRAVMFVENDTYVLVPLEGGDLGRRHPHLLYRSLWHQKVGCANGEQTEWGRSLNKKHSFQYMRRQKRDAEKERKYLEVAVVADYNLASQYDFDIGRLLPSVLETINIVDLIYYKNLNTRLSLVYLEAWMQNNIITLSGDIRQTMLNFLEYSSRELYSEKKDLAIFLTPHRFARRESTMSSSGSICTEKAATVVQVASPFRLYETAAKISHAIGHVLGMKHDTTGSACDCDNTRSCVMQDIIGIKHGTFAWGFSECSTNDYLSTLAVGHGRCLFNKPLQNDQLKMCGNKMVDDGEDCDCGNIEECIIIDPCCDPVTCKLKSDAECASGPCCDACKLRSSQHVCRESSNECDAPESCTGNSGMCPVDSRKVNGVSCLNGEGVCYEGNCVSRNSQCTEMWGKGSVDSEIDCYERFNILGFQHGHCGVNEDGSYIPCDLRNVRCGLLHCQNGSDAKLNSGVALKTKIVSGRSTFECKSVSDKQLSMVRDGAKCGQNGICLSGACVPVSDVSTEPVCPTNNLALKCSGHGECTTENWCYCNSGWTGTDCGTRLSIKNPTGETSMFPVSINSDEILEGLGKPYDMSHNRLDVSSMLIILGGVAGGIILLLLFLLLCYRYFSRRTTSALRKKKLAAGMDMDRGSESSIDTAQRSIKFGSMPSYKDEKLRQKKRQRRTLHKIHEVSDERDSMSNKSKESGDPNISVPFSPAGKAGSSPGCNVPPDRGILKNCSLGTPRSFSDAEVVSPLLPRQYSDLVVSTNPGTPSADGGYESEPPAYTAYRIFEKSLRKLDEYECTNPYHVPVMQCADGTSVVIRSPKSDYWDGRKAHLAIQGNPVRFYQHSKPTRNSAQVFTPPVNRSNPVPLKAMRNGYATDSEIGYTPELRRRPSDSSSAQQNAGSSQEDSWAESPPRSYAHQRSESSPTNSLASSRQPQPIKLRNIEYLLKQLETNTCPTTSPTSSAEFSATEADKCAMEECYRRKREESWGEKVLPNDSGRKTDTRLGSESCDMTVVESFNCNPSLPGSSNSRFSDRSTPSVQRSSFGSA